jgi:hypothetical protein
MSKVKKKAKSVSSTRTKSVKERTAKTNIAECLDILDIFNRRTNSIGEVMSSLSRASHLHYNMLIALQQQITCLEAKTKILEEKIRRLV